MLSDSLSDISPGTWLISLYLTSNLAKKNICHIFWHVLCPCYRTFCILWSYPIILIINHHEKWFIHFFQCLKFIVMLVYLHGKLPLITINHYELPLITINHHWSPMFSSIQKPTDRKWWLIEGSLEAKLPTICRDGKAEVGRVRRGEVKKWEDQRGRKSEERRCRCAKR